MIEITGSERDALILRILNSIDADEQRIAAPERTAVWERGWAEALHQFRLNPCAESLAPAFIRERPIRLQRRFWHAPHGYERDYCRNVQTDFLASNLTACDSIYEFGCGTGWNLAGLAALMPEKRYVGFDFSPAAVELVNEAGKRLNLPLHAVTFDMAEPAGHLEHGGVFTFGAIEQTPHTFKVFIDWLIQQKPAIVAHVEPILELYDPDNLVDALAIAFHTNRGYTQGLLPYLQSHPDIEVINVERAFFGSLMHEGYSRILWRPR